MTQVTLTKNPKSPNLGEQMQIAAACVEGLTNVHLDIFQPSENKLYPGKVAHSRLGDLHIWTWLTDKVHERGEHIVIFTADGGIVMEDAFLPSVGTPRIQYERTYVLLPQDADAAWAKVVIEETWNQNRYTIGSSADDAGIGDLDVRRIIAINPSHWQGDLKAFYEEYYPEVDLVCINASTPDELRGRFRSSPLLMWQCDPAWANHKIAGQNCRSTLCALGCWVCCCAMAEKHFGLDANATPALTNSKLGPTGFSGCECKWSAMEEHLNLKVLKKTYYLHEALAHLDTGGGVFIQVYLGAQKHFVLGTRHEGSRIWIYDPYKNVEGFLDEYYPRVDSYRLVAPVSMVPTPVKFLRGLHDRAGGDWLESKKLPGYCLVLAYLDGLKPLDLKLNFEHVKVLVNFRYSYARDDGGKGTMPGEDFLQAYEDACIETMWLNPNAELFIYGNEMNNQREWPVNKALTPEYYLRSYNRVWANAPKGARLAPGAIDPFNPGWGDWRVCWKRVLENITGADALVFHAYSHGTVYDHNQQFGDDPLKGVYYNLRVLESQQAIVPTRFRVLPQYVTETNHGAPPAPIHWEDDGRWVRDAYAYFASRGVLTGCLFRYNHDDWRLSHLPQVLAAVAS